MNADELQRQKENIGGLISINTFLLTRIDQTIALEELSYSNVLESVFYEIEIDTSITTKPYANVTVENKSGILLSIGSVFRIESVKMNQNGIWLVKLKWGNDVQMQLKHTLELIKNKIGDIPTLFLTVGMLWDKVGDYSKSDMYYRALIENLPKDNMDTGKLHNFIGDLFCSRGDYSLAISQHERAIAIYKTSLLAPTHHLFAYTYGNIGLIHSQSGNYYAALKYFNITLDTLLKTLPPNHLDLTQTYSNIAQVYRNICNYTLSLENNKRILEIQLAHFSPVHSSIATTLNNIGSLFLHKSDGITALKYHRKALMVQLKSLSHDHLSVANTYNNMGLVYHFRKEYTKALDNFNKALDIQQKLTEPSNMGMTLINIAMVQCEKRQFTLALENLEKTLGIYKKVYSLNHPTIALVYDCFGSVYQIKGEFKMALKMFENVLKIQSQCFPNNHPDIGGTYNNLGGVHDDMGDYERALKYYYKALVLAHEILPQNHPDIELYQHNITEVKRKLA
ncbi:unnamed protein product [Didymodactylos carnosus]|nr:unnamed protein product [Didymodactylos carnosus]CAF3833124.1 unnamed protein product [Didymodactylos carnosus]